MNKVQLKKFERCWVISEGRKGHEIQSSTLAEVLSVQADVFRFTLRQPWQSFAPRLIPGFAKGLAWEEKPPQDPPDLIITTGRQAAAVGKWLKRQHPSQTKHIQVLNPRDRFSKYDAVLIPEHDREIASAHVRFHGSIHPFGDEAIPDPVNNAPITLIIGNPPIKYFKKDFEQDLAQIRKAFANNQLIICGSPRLNNAAKKLIKAHTKPQDRLWLSNEDGPNPYHELRLNSRKLFVTTDSINMLCECCAGTRPVSALAASHITSPKHQRYLTSINKRLCALDEEITGPIPPKATTQICSHPMIQGLMISPSSSSSG